jgi:hypothetical protein
MTHTVTISIGRNDGPATRSLGRAVPMAPPEWDSFRESITLAVDVVYGTGHGTGEWEGVTEETFLLVGVVADVVALRARLAVLAAEYRQDAIGLVAQLGTDTAVSA